MTTLGWASRHLEQDWISMDILWSSVTQSMVVKLVNHRYVRKYINHVAWLVDFNDFKRF